jgi:hypothetical protein
MLNLACMYAFHGDANVSIFFWLHLVNVKKKLVRDLHYRQTGMVPVEHGVGPAVHQMTPNFASVWACQWKASMQNLKQFGHQTHIASHAGIILGIFHSENPQKCI